MIEVLDGGGVVKIRSDQKKKRVQTVNISRLKRCYGRKKSGPGDEQELEDHILDIWKHLPENKVLLDHFLDGAIEAENL